MAEPFFAGGTDDAYFPATTNSTDAIAASANRSRRTRYGIKKPAPPMEVRAF